MILYTFNHRGNYYAVSLYHLPDRKKPFVLCLNADPIRKYNRKQDAKATATKWKKTLENRGIKTKPF